MNSLRLEFEWQDPAGAKGAELRATWASLSIFIDQTPITELQDRRTKSVRTSIFLPLFPLAEWFASNWWFLQSEAERLGPADDRAFDQRHNLRWAREGFVLPSLRLVTQGDTIDVQWEPLDVCHAGISFRGKGQADLSGAACRETIRNFVNAVVARLDESGVSETSLHQEWATIQNADCEEQDFCHAAARLGIDPYAVDSQQEELILDVASRIPTELLNDLLSLSSVDSLQNRAEQLAKVSADISGNSDAVDPFTALRRLSPPLVQEGNSWETGYRFAERLRAKINHHSWKSKSIDDLAEKLNLDQVNRCMLPASGDCGFIDALMGLNQLGKPMFLIEKQRPDSRQFAFCRILFEHLTAPHDRFAVVSALHNDRQRMNRAFAAEFLVPHDQLQQDLSGSLIGEDEITQLSAAYGVSTRVIEHQIQNHQLAHIQS